MSDIKLKNVDVFAVVIGYITLLAMGLLDNARGPAFPDITADLGLTATQASLFFAVASTLAFFGSQSVPWVQHRTNTMTGLRIGLALMGFGFGLISFASNLTTLLLSCCVFGFGLGLVNVFENIIIQEGATENTRRRLFSGLHSMYALSSVLAPFLISWMYENQISWRTVFLLFSLTPYVVIVVTLFRRPHKTVNEATATVKTAERSTAKWHRPDILIMGFFLGFYVAGELSISTRLPLLLRNDFGYSAVSASNMLGYFFILMLVGRALMTMFHLRMRSFSILFLSLVLTLLFYLVGLFLDPWGLVACGLFLAPFFGVAVDYFSEVFGKDVVPALSFGLAAGSCTVVPMQILLGWLMSTMTLKQALLVGPLCFVASLVLLVIHRQRYLKA